MVAKFSEQKHLIVEALLPLCPFLHVLGDSPSVEGLPKALQRPDLVLRIGRDPRVLGMVDLELDATGFSGTISVQPARHFLKVPWEAITRCWIGPPFNGPLAVWPQLVAEEPAKPPERPGLRLV